MKGTKRFGISDSNFDANDSLAWSKRKIAGSTFDSHKAEPSQKPSMGTPPLDAQRAESSRQHVRALNTQFASWVQSQLQNHPDELWEDGVQDYLLHASNIMDKYSDVVDWLRANSAKGVSVSAVGSHTVEQKLIPESRYNEKKLFQEKTSSAPFGPPTTLFQEKTSFAPVDPNATLFQNRTSSASACPTTTSLQEKTGFAPVGPNATLFQNKTSSAPVGPTTSLLQEKTDFAPVNSILFQNKSSSAPVGPASTLFQDKTSFVPAGLNAAFILNETTTASVGPSTALFQDKNGSASVGSTTTLFQLKTSSAPGAPSTTLFQEKTGSASVGPTTTFAPSWNSGVFFNNQTSVVFGSQKMAPISHDASGDVDDENDGEQPSSPSVKKTEEKGVIVVHQVKCKLYVKSTDLVDKDTWKDRGTGQLSIKCKEGVSKGTKESKPTIVVRNDVGKVLLNALLYPGIKTNSQKNSVVAIFHTLGDGGGTDDSSNEIVARTFLIRTKTEDDRNKLAAAINDYSPAP